MSPSMLKFNGLWLRIVKELIEHENLYLSNDYLNSAKGLSKVSVDDIVVGSNCCGGRVTIQDIYRAEALKVMTPGSYMGLWQVYALSSVFSHPIMSVYPKIGCLRNHEVNHRLILPQQSSDPRNATTIIRSSTRHDLKEEYWVPNHFCLAVPVMSAR